MERRSGRWHALHAPRAERGRRHKRGMGGGGNGGKVAERRGRGGQVMPSPSWRPQYARSPASPCSSRTPAAYSSRGSGSRGAQACDAARQKRRPAGQTRMTHARGDRVRTVPQNSCTQWGHLPTMRRTAWLQGVSDWNWQRFLAGMAVETAGGRVRGRAGGTESAGEAQSATDVRERGQRGRALTGRVGDERYASKGVGSGCGREGWRLIWGGRGRVSSRYGSEIAWRRCRMTRSRCPIHVRRAIRASAPLPGRADAAASLATGRSCLAPSPTEPPSVSCQHQPRPLVLSAMSRPNTVCSPPWPPRPLPAAAPALHPPPTIPRRELLAFNTEPYHAVRSVLPSPP